PPLETADPDRDAIAVEHERIAFPSFPYEWPAEMLHAAATLTLDIAEGLAGEGLGLKDGTPYNVLYRGPTPVFVDVLCLERRDPRDPNWPPYAQFVRTFLLPLLAAKHLGHGLDQIFLTRRDGLEAEEVLGWLSFAQKLRQPFLSLVSIPAWFSGQQARALEIPVRGRFIAGTPFRRLRRVLRGIE
ncbi:MAG: SAM-dependent methyltransferase, partial [bacterium]|nr:SAM-dependent methyltransferase [bacterium]